MYGAACCNVFRSMLSVEHLCRHGARPVQNIIHNNWRFEVLEAIYDSILVTVQLRIMDWSLLTADYILKH